MSDAEKVIINVEGIDESKKKIKDVTLPKLWRVINVVVALAFITFVISVVSIIQADDRNTAIDRLETAVERIEGSVSDVKTFVDEIKAERDEAEEAGNGANQTAAAVQVIFEIKAILCSQYEQSEVCANP